MRVVVTSNIVHYLAVAIPKRKTTKTKKKKILESHAQSNIDLDDKISTVRLLLQCINC